MNDGNRDGHPRDGNHDGNHDGNDGAHHGNRDGNRDGNDLHHTPFVFSMPQFAQVSWPYYYPNQAQIYLAICVL